MSARQRRLQLTGLVGSGKSTLAQRLVVATQGEKLSFAQPVYALVERVVGGAVDKANPQNRELLKRMGTEWGREGQAPPSAIWATIKEHVPAGWGRSDVWAQALVERSLKLADAPLLVNDDLRFANELALSDAAGFVPFLVACRHETRLARLNRRGETYDGNDPSHLSEAFVNALHDRSFEDDVIPVVWIDESCHQPKRPWIYSLAEFEERVLMAPDGPAVEAAFRWDHGRRQRLAEFAAEVSDPLGSRAHRQPGLRARSWT